MKRYSNTKKFLLWFFFLLLILFFLVIAWRSMKRAADMRPQSPDQEQRDTGRGPEENREKKNAPTTDDPTSLALSELVEQPHFGWPASPVQVLELLEFKAFALAYDEQHEQAAWVAYRLTAQGKTPRHERYDRFMADDKVSTGSAHPNDYTNSGYDRGHLAPAGDFSTDKEALKETFYMSNMSPQKPAFNRGIWSKLENQVRDWAEDNQDIWVVTGPVLRNQKRLKKIGENKVSVPRYYYKVILDAREPDIKMIGFVLENQGSSKELSNFVVPVDSVEGLTGLDFFPMLPDQLEENLESQHNTGNWDIN